MKTILNFKKLLISASLLFYGAMFVNNALAYQHEVWKSGSKYYWKTFNVTRGSSSNLTTAIEGAMGSGNRDIHVITSGTLNSTIKVRAAGVRLHCHGNTFTCNFSGSGILNNGHDGFEIHDLTLKNVKNGYGIRSSAANNLRFTNVKTIGIAWIGMRIDSRTSNPWNHTIKNLYMKNCRFENCGSHGLETYSIDGFTLKGTMTAKNCGGCGVLFNNSRNGTVETVNAYNCCWGGGYAGLRYANKCYKITTNKLYADRCGRGFFIVKSGPTKDCHLNYAEIRKCSDVGIWIEKGYRCSVKSGCSESGKRVSGSGSYAKVSSRCGGSSSGKYYYLQNRATGLRIDGYGQTSNGAICKQHKNTTHKNAQWKLEKTGSYYYITNRATGMRIDGYGHTSNGSYCRQYKNTTHKNAQWKLEKTGNYYYITNRATGMRIDGYGQTSNGSYCRQYKNTTHKNAQWRLISARSTKSATTENSTEVASDLNIYPNPSINGNFTVDIPGLENTEIVNIEIYSYDGKKLFNQEYSGENRIAVNLNLQEGLYIVSVKHGNQITSKKIIVK